MSSSSSSSPSSRLAPPPPPPSSPPPSSPQQQQQQQQPNRRIGFAESFFLSGSAAAISKTAAAPIERVKLLVQNQNELLKQGKLDRAFTGVRDCVGTTLRNEGALSFWRGNFASVLRYFPQQALNFAFKDQIQRAFRIPKTASHAERFSKNILSGGCAGSLSLLFVQSIDYTRTRLATDARRSNGGERQFKGIVDCYVKTYRADGVAGLYRGFVVSCVCIFIYRGLYFGLYDSLKPLLLGERAEDSWAATFALGWAVTITSGIVAYPIDTVKRRMMMTSGETVKYSGSIDCLKQVVRTEGSRALFKGAGVNVVRGVAGAGVLSGFDRFKKIYVGWRFQEQQQHQKL